MNDELDSINITQLYTTTVQSTVALYLAQLAAVKYTLKSNNVT